MERSWSGQVGVGGRVWDRAGAAPGAPRSEGRAGGGGAGPISPRAALAGVWESVRCGRAAHTEPGRGRPAGPPGDWRGAAGSGAPAPVFVNALRHTAGAGSRTAPRAGRAWGGCARWGTTGLPERRFPVSAARWGWGRSAGVLRH